MFCLPSGLTEYKAAGLTESESGTIKDSVFGIVLKTIIDNKQEVSLKGLEVWIVMSLQQNPHGLEIHWTLNVVQVVRHLDKIQLINTHAHIYKQIHMSGLLFVCVSPTVCVCVGGWGVRLGVNVLLR